MAGNRCYVLSHLLPLLQAGVAIFQLRDSECGEAEPQHLHPTQRRSHEAHACGVPREADNSKTMLQNDMAL